jgi:sulfoxide reductase heme-binding subunit YedZ
MTIWILLRAAGIGAYVALWLSVAWGLIATTGIVKRRISKPSANLFHASVATTGLVLLAVHLVLLVVHTYMPFSAVDLLIPMRSTFRPWAITAGIIAMYAVVALMVSSWLRGSLNTKLWRAIHLIAVPAFVLALLHGVFAGTDTERPWMIALYAMTGVLTFFLVVVRGLTADYRPPRPTPPVREPRRTAAANTP